MSTLKITQIKSVISEKQYQRDTLRTLGLKKIGQTVEREESPSVIGMIRTVAHLVTVEEVEK
jgi:large subunit ribosomal protein L30